MLAPRSSNNSAPVPVLARMTVNTIIGGSSNIYPSLSDPTAVAVSPDGSELFVFDGGANQIFRAALVKGYPIDAGSVFAGGASGDFGDNGPSLSAGLSAGYGLAVTPGGSLLVSDTGALWFATLGRWHSIQPRLCAGNDRVRVVMSVPEPPRPLSVIAGSGVQTPYVDNAPALSAVVGAPVYIVAQPNRDVVFSDAKNYVVRSASYGAGRVTRLAGTSGVSGFSGGPALSARLGRPAGVCVGPSSEFYIAGECVRGLGSSGWPASLPLPLSRHGEQRRVGFNPWHDKRKSFHSGWHWRVVACALQYDDPAAR